MELAAGSERPSIRRTPQAQDRRRHKRVQWAARVRGLTSEGEEFEAVTVDAGPGGLRICLARPLRIGEPLILYIDDIGRVEGVVARILRDIGYAIQFRVPLRKREKIADQLTWAINRERLGLAEEREAERRLGGSQVVAVYNGVSIACTVMDMSIFGVALKTNGPRPMIGDRVTVGDRSGACVRYIEGGFALDFRTVTND
jgi:hypothetical protein